METTGKATTDSLFEDLENNKPFAKIALEGFAGDGKTRTAVELAIGIHKLIGSKKPIAAIDTERAIHKLKRLFDAEGITVKRNESRTLATASAIIKACAEGYADVLIIDSITHIWEEFKNAYMKSKRKNNTYLEFQDWNNIKPRWKTEFSDVFVLANCHIIFTGRAGYEYEDEKNEETGKREIFKSGIKMKAENETAYEPDMLILMERVQEIMGEDKRIYRTATILKDRTELIDGLTLNKDGKEKGPTFGMFYPAIKEMLDGAVRAAHGYEIPDTFEEFRTKFDDNSKKRTVSIAEIETSFQLIGLGTSKEDKALKAATLKKVFGFTSLEGVETLSPEMIADGCNVIRDFASDYLDYLTECKDTGTTPELTEYQSRLEKSLNPLNI